MKRMLPIAEWGLDKKSLKIVKKRLNEVLTHFNMFADVRFTNDKLSNIERCDFTKMKFFYYTDCRDLISKNIEMKGVESNLIIRHRKRAKLLSMLISTLLGNDHNKKRPCTHCDYPERIIDGFADGSGHFIICPKCGLTTIITYPPFYDSCIDSLKRGIADNGIGFKNS